MSRLPFDAGKMAAAAKAGQRPGDEAGNLTVSQLAALIAQVVNDKVVRPLRVIGEVSNFTDRTHWYFHLKDAGAVVPCVMFQSAARKAGFTPSVGQEVVVSGFVDFYVPQGKLTFRVEKLEPVGAGALEIAYKKLCEELRGLGWFDAGRKRELPVFPRRVAVITSRTGAALQDVIDTMRRRAPFVELCLVDTMVQGAGAAPGIAAAIRWVSANAARLGIETLIVTRGGGSMEDLWAFNDREVAAAIEACEIPVAAAIGHETDTTIAELVADARCATPTQAAMRCTPDGGAIGEQVEAARGRLLSGLRGAWGRARQSLVSSDRQLSGSARAKVLMLGRAVDQLAARMEVHRPVAVYERRRAALAAAAAQLQGAVDVGDARRRASELADRLAMAGERAARLWAERMKGAERELELVGPASVLSRGYSVTFGPDGRVLRRVQDAKPGEVITTKLSEGTVESIVKGLADVGVRHGERRARRAKPDVQGQQRLFGEGAGEEGAA